MPSRRIAIYASGVARRVVPRDHALLLQNLLIHESCCYHHLHQATSPPTLPRAIPLRHLPVATDGELPIDPLQPLWLLCTYRASRSSWRGLGMASLYHHLLVYIVVAISIIAVTVPRRRLE